MHHTLKPHHHHHHHRRRRSKHSVSEDLPPSSPDHAETKVFINIKIKILDLKMLNIVWYK